MMLIFMLLFRFTNESKANDITVVDVRRNITLAEDDKVYKDFYINAGPTSGLKKNLVVTAVRKINIRDASGANAVGEILVPVGQLKVIAVYDHVAVAREYTLLSRDELPMLEQVGIMNGDRIDLNGAFIDNTKPKAKLKTAQDLTTENSQNLVTTSVTTVTSQSISTAGTTAGTTPSETKTSKAPASPAMVTAPPGKTSATPVVSAKANASAEALPEAPIKRSPTASPTPGDKGETLEKTADSGNKSS